MIPNLTELVPLIKKYIGGFLDGAVVKNPLVYMGDMGLIPGLGRSHVPWSNWARVPQLLSPCSRARGLQQEKPPQWEAAHHNQRGAPLTAARENSAQPKMNQSIKFFSKRISDRETCAQWESHMKDEGRNQGRDLEANGCQRVTSGRHESFSLTTLRSHQRWWRLDFRLPASRIMKEWISVI